MRRIGKRIALGVVGLLGGTVLLVLLMGLLVLWKPQIIFNDTVFPKVASMAFGLVERLGWKINARTLHVDVESVSFFTKRLRLRARGLCIEGDEVGVRLCGEEFDVSLVAVLNRLPPLLASVDSLVWLGGHAEIRPPEDPPSQTEGPPSDLWRDLRSTFADASQGIGLLFRDTSWGRVRVEFSRIDWDELQGSATVRSIRDERVPFYWVGTLSADVPDLGRWQGHLHLSNTLMNARGQWSIRAEAQGGFPFEGRMSRIRARLRGDQHATLARLDLSGDAQWGLGKKKARMSLKGALQPSGRESLALSVVLDAEATRLLPELRKVSVRHCRLEMKGGAVGRAHFETDCPLTGRVRLSRMRGAPAAAVVLRWTAEFESSAIPDPEAYWDGKTRVELDPVATSLLRVKEGFIEVRFHGAPVELVGELVQRMNGQSELGQLKRESGLESEMKLALEVPQSDAIQQLLKDTDFEPPAPIRPMTGMVRLDVKGGIAYGDTTPPPGKGLHAEVGVQVRLASEGQNLEADAEGQMGWISPEGGKPQVVANLLLRNIVLNLPTLSIGQPPRFETRVPRLVPDSRVILPGEEQEEEVESPLDFDIRIRTDPNPVQVRSNLALAMIPIRMDLKIRSDQEMAGSIEIGEAPLRFIRRDAAVERFAVNWDPRGTQTLNGRVRVRYTDYTVFIDLMGPADKPEIRLSSQPPLPENDIISVLIFGKTQEELDPDEAQSSGSAGAAIANRALGLGSLYLLASTPVERIDYNPRTGQVVAKFRLGQGFSLDVGGGGEAGPVVGLRKRLGGHWSLQTSYGGGPQGLAVSPQSNALSAWLEWANRY